MVPGQKGIFRSACKVGLRQASKSLSGGIVDVINVRSPHEWRPRAKILDDKIRRKEFNRNLIRFAKFGNRNEIRL